MNCWLIKRPFPYSPVRWSWCAAPVFALVVLGGCTSDGPETDVLSSSTSSGQSSVASRVTEPVVVTSDGPDVSGQLEPVGLALAPGSQWLLVSTDVEGLEDAINLFTLTFSEVDDLKMFLRGELHCNVVDADIVQVAGVVEVRSGGISEVGCSGADQHRTEARFARLVWDAVLEQSQPDRLEAVSPGGVLMFELQPESEPLSD